MNQSLQLQRIDKARAPQVLGWIVATGSAASLLSYGLLVLTWQSFGLSYAVFYGAGGGLCAICLFAYLQFEAPEPQFETFVLPRRYWVYYALQFMSGALRQIFVVFAGFMMVERFDFEVHEITALLLVNYVASIVIAPLLGRAAGVFGERAALSWSTAG